jgi:hypothetical protein
VRMRPSAAMTVRRWRGERACRTVLQKEPDVDPCEDSEWCAAVDLFVYPRVEEAMAALRGPLDGRPATVRGTSGFESTAQICRSASPIAGSVALPGSADFVGACWELARPHSDSAFGMVGGGGQRRPGRWCGHGPVDVSHRAPNRVPRRSEVSLSRRYQASRASDVALICRTIGGLAGCRRSRRGPFADI